MTDNVNKQPSRISIGAVITLVIISFGCGLVAGLSSSNNAPITGPLPATSQTNSLKTEVAAVATTQPSVIAEVPSSTPEAPTPDEMALAKPTSLGDMKLSAMSQEQWAEYKAEFVQKNPGLEQLDGLAPLFIEEFSSSQPEMTADAAMKGALARASLRWAKQQRAAATDPIPALVIPSPITAVKNEDAATTPKEQPEGPVQAGK